MEVPGIYPSVAWLNGLDDEAAVDALTKCCHSAQFARLVARARPFDSYLDLVQHARDVWMNQVGVPSWLDAFAGHPRIGDVEGLREKFGASAEFSEGEQGAALATADDATLQELALWNKNYEDKFGHVFLICASGKSSAEVLAAVKARFPNSPHQEIRIAALEQQKITELRLEKLLEPPADSDAHSPNKPSIVPHPTSALASASNRGANRVLSSLGPEQSTASASHIRGVAQGRLAQIGDHLTAGRGREDPVVSRQGQSQRDVGNDRFDPHTLSAQPTAAGTSGLRSPITTHVLDLSHGRPAEGVAVELQGLDGDTWHALGQGATDADGRVINLLPASNEVAAGLYKLRFETGAYLQSMPNASRGDPGRVGADGGFYPLVELVFEVKRSQTREHFHVPLILSPYSYTTYRGS